MIKKYTIYGERCSGTNYLENLINTNFDVELTWEYGWKHFFGFNKELKNSNDTLFICIIRDPVDWINSFFKNPHHLPKHLKRDIDIFLNNEFYSIYDNGNNKEILEDRNIYTGNRYKNIYELRHIKIKWLIEYLPKKVKNCILIKYEDLLNNFEETMNKLKRKGLKVKDNIEYPLNIKYYKKCLNIKYEKKKNIISSDIILKNHNLIPFYEKKFYNIYST
jgi:hypothetical protein